MFKIMKKYFVAYLLHRILNRAGDFKDEFLNEIIEFQKIEKEEDIRKLEKHLVEKRANAEPSEATLLSFQELS